MLPHESLMKVIYLNLVSKGDFSGQKKCKLFLPSEMFIAEFSAGKIYGPCFLYRKWILYIVKYFPSDLSTLALFSQINSLAKLVCSHLGDCSNGKMLISGSDVGFCVSLGTPRTDTPTNHTTHIILIDQPWRLL